MNAETHTSFILIERLASTRAPSLRSLRRKGDRCGVQPGTVKLLLKDPRIKNHLAPDETRFDGGFAFFRGGSGASLTCPRAR
jgi:hypothetical protein